MVGGYRFRNEKNGVVSTEATEHRKSIQSRRIDANVWDGMTLEDVKNSELPILISFSGGRTSAFMAKLLLEYPMFAEREKVVCFANTGKEFPATLDFVNECDKRWNLNVVWLEAEVHQEKGVGTTHKIVTHDTASRNGEPFEAMIRKYGIPNKQYPHCTRELKQMPIRKYMKSLGYKEWITALGIRSDEPHRLSRGNDSNLKYPFFPLVDIIQVDEAFIRGWWDRQDFDLDLKDYQSNCDLCWKKSKRKRLTLIEEDVTVADWWLKMEEKYGGDYQFDQREGLTIPDLVELAKHPFQKAIDKHELRKAENKMFEPDMDLEWDCFCKST